MSDERGKLGDGFVIRIPSKAKVSVTSKTPPRRKGPYPVDEEELRPPAQQLKIVLSDISTLYQTNNRTNNGFVAAEDLELGRAAIGAQLASFFGGDTYGVSLVEFTEETIAAANQDLLFGLEPGGG
jgi:hypothetical protein